MGQKPFKAPIFALKPNFKPPRRPIKVTQKAPGCFRAISSLVLEISTNKFWFLVPIRSVWGVVAGWC